uniref:G_PROTEIN_RECEP_F1_2 domain-containing protein n=1 Tax=Brugia timori TaxID=42155 RepID=A0A0R3QQL7_9BILA
LNLRFMDEYIGSNWNPVLPISTDATFSSETTVLGTSVSHHLTWGAIVLSVIMGAISVVTVVGNLAVLLCYYLDKNIRQPSNYFIFSLAVSDLVSSFLIILYLVSTNFFFFQFV